MKRLDVKMAEMKTPNANPMWWQVVVVVGQVPTGEKLDLFVKERFWFNARAAAQKAAERDDVDAVEVSDDYYNAHQVTKAVRERARKLPKPKVAKTKKKRV